MKRIYDALVESEVDPRDNWEYMLSKMQVDYRLLGRIDTKGKSVLNIGCGFPIDEIYLGSRIGEWVSADISPATIKKARMQSSHELSGRLFGHYHFVETDSTKLPFNNESFDVVLSLSTIDHIPGKERRESVCSEIYRVTRRGGYCIITVPNRLSVFYYIRSKRKQKGDKSLWYEHCFTPSELKELLRESGFGIVAFASTMSGRTGARGPIIRQFVGGIEKYILQHFGTRMGYLCRKPL